MPTWTSNKKAKRKEQESRNGQEKRLEPRDFQQKGVAFGPLEGQLEVAGVNSVNWNSNLWIATIRIQPSKASQLSASHGD